MFVLYGKSEVTEMSGSRRAPTGTDAQRRALTHSDGSQWATAEFDASAPILS